jgi:hypothetical protein
MEINMIINPKTITTSEVERTCLTTALVNYVAYEYYRHKCAKSASVKGSCLDNIDTSTDLLYKVSGSDGLALLKAKCSKYKSFKAASL